MKRDTRLCISFHLAPYIAVKTTSICFGSRRAAVYCNSPERRLKGGFKRRRIGEETRSRATGRENYDYVSNCEGRWFLA